MPTLIMALLACVRRFYRDAGERRVRRGRVLRSALRELLATTRFVQTDLLALDFARVARDEAGLRQRRLELRVVVDERARDPMAYRPRLTGFAAAPYVD